MADCDARRRPPGLHSAQMGTHRTQGVNGVGRRQPGPFGSNQEAPPGPTIGLRGDLRLWPCRVGADQGPVTKTALVWTPGDNNPSGRLGLLGGWDVAHGDTRGWALRLGPVEAAVHLPPAFEGPKRTQGGCGNFVRVPSLLRRQAPSPELASGFAPWICDFQFPGGEIPTAPKRPGL